MTDDASRFEPPQQGAHARVLEGVLRQEPGAHPIRGGGPLAEMKSRIARCRPVSGCDES